MGWGTRVGPPPPARLSWWREVSELWRVVSAMTAELQQDDGAGAADRHGSVGPVEATGRGVGGLRLRREEGCGAIAGAARVAGGRALKSWALGGGAAEGVRAVRQRG